MPQNPSSDSHVARPQRSPSQSPAYLVVRYGGSVRDVYRLTPGQVTTLGRSPTNRVVIHDDVCSRNHCEIFQSGSEWTLRDLGSRNGTTVNGQRISGDWNLSEGELIEIGRCQMGFTYDLSHPIRGLRQLPRAAEYDSETAIDLVFDEPPSDLEPAIVHRTRNSRYHSSAPPDTLGFDRTGRELARLYRLALEMGSAATSKQLTDVVLRGLFSGTSADIGAILLLPAGETASSDPGKLHVIAYNSVGDVPYQRVSEYLSRTVMADHEAILARDVADDSHLAGRDSLGQIRAESVICAPIRAGDSVHGLIHLYSTNPDKPLDADDLEFTLAVADQLAVALDNLIARETLQAGLAQVRDENQSLRRQLELESELVGDSSPMKQLRAIIARIAPTQATALIRGESGVGKELVARAIHFSSPRRDQPLVCLNCAALSESLLESELFGHERGAFTGAVERKSGKFEQAHGGTLFLDEVGDMSLSLQSKFLRALEGHAFERVGGGTSVKADVRVVAATNRDLEAAVKGGLFRKDLYFRLQVLELVIPALRERKSDIPMLSLYFLRRFARRADCSVVGFTPEALEILVGYDWPGNVRELQNVVERAVILCGSSEISPSDIRLSSLEAQAKLPWKDASELAAREASLETIEQEYILATLERTNWNKSRAAQILGIERSTLDRKLRRYQVDRPLP
ncbi:MAG: sigma 54-interacting transcriptional regulator [Planctomycetaceae bacterium]